MTNVNNVLNIENIIFSDKDHTYRKNSIKYNSVSSTISKYKNPFDEKYWGTYKVYQKLLGKERFDSIRKSSVFLKGDYLLFDKMKPLVNQDEFDSELQSLYNEWKETNIKSITKGKEYHDFKEKQAFELGYSVNPFTNEKYKTIASTLIIEDDDNQIRTPAVKSLKDLEDGYHPELILWNDQNTIAGQADKVYITTKDDKRYVFIDDWKSNKKIVKTNYFDKMLSPLSHLDDANWIHYQLQISIYAWMLEQEGYIVAGTSITHINRHMPFEYLKKEVESIMPNFLDI